MSKDPAQSRIDDLPLFSGSVGQRAGAAFELPEKPRASATWSRADGWIARISAQSRYVVASGGSETEYAAVWRTAYAVAQEALDVWSARGIADLETTDPYGGAPAPLPADVLKQRGDGGLWSEEARKSWSRRTFAQAVKAAQVEHLPPKDLRHSFASLLAHEGRSGPYIADQLGHGLEVSQSTYQHILRELEDQPRVSAEDAIRQARESLRGARSVLSGTD